MFDWHSHWIRQMGAKERKIGSYCFHINCGRVDSGRQIMAEWWFARWFLNAIRNVVFPVRRHKVHWRQLKYVTIEWSSNVAAVRIAVGFPEIDIGFSVILNPNLNESATIWNSMNILGKRLPKWVWWTLYGFASNVVHPILISNHFVFGNSLGIHFIDLISRNSVSVLRYFSQTIQINLVLNEILVSSSSICQSKQIILSK